MRILVLHNRYRQRGGEDESTEGEVRLLRGRGHTVYTLFADNHSFGKLGAIKVGWEASWNFRKYLAVRRLIQQAKPEVVSVHNFFPLLSPSVLYAARAENVPVVLSLHNFRLICPSGGLFRDGTVCLNCVGHKWPWPAFIHGCYRNSHLATLGPMVMNGVHNSLKTWSQKVNLFVSLSNSARKLFEQAGIPPQKLRVKPNFVFPDPGPGSGGGNYVFFAGRLSPEKGLITLFNAWRLLKRPPPLPIAGKGPLSRVLWQQAPSGVTFLGERSLQEVYALLGEAKFLIVPSECIETFGRVVIESFAKGTPVIVSDRGALPELVEHGRTGLVFKAGDPHDLAEKISWLLDHPRDAAQMRQEARQEFLRKYTAERNYELMMQIFEEARGQVR